MSPNQNKARNEAFQLLTIAHRIADDAGLIAYAADIQAVIASMRMDAKMLQQQEMNRVMP